MKKKKTGKNSTNWPAGALWMDIKKDSTELYKQWKMDKKYLLNLYNTTSKGK